jgi:hypothetical protein
MLLTGNETSAVRTSEFRNEEKVAVGTAKGSTIKAVSRGRFHILMKTRQHFNEHLHVMKFYRCWEVALPNLRTGLGSNFGTRWASLFARLQFLRGSNFCAAPMFARLQFLRGSNFFRGGSTTR